MKKTIYAFVAILAIFVFTAGTCERLPDPEIPDDTPDCEAAGANLVRLECKEAWLPDGTSFQNYCEDVQEKGHALNPSCLKDIKACSEISTVCGQ